MSNTAECENCRFFKSVGVGSRLGQCIKLPPVICPIGKHIGGVSAEDIYSITRFPVVNGQEYCGEFQIRKDHSG